jgi:asparagine synthase (glutamine-hydrolysing)
MEKVVRRALLRPPCVVSFSGGRDSSAVLAVAAHVARREQLAPPIAVTLTFPGCESADETAWQALVLRHLGIEDWIRLPFDDELDVVGPHARTVLSRCGLLWPANVHSHLPIAAQAAGGTVLTGFGGDELLTTSSFYYRVNTVLTGQARLRPRDLVRIAVCHGPKPVRRAGMRWRLRAAPPYPWLRPAAARAVREATVQAMIEDPVHWGRSVDHGWWRTRYRKIGVESLGQVAALHGATACSPFADPTMLAAIAGEGGRCGFSSRSAAMQHLVGDLLPPELVGRVSKAEFGRAFGNQHAHALASRWDGGGIDPALVDVDALRRMWLSPGQPDSRAFSLLQAVWLHLEGLRIDLLGEPAIRTPAAD